MPDRIGSPQRLFSQWLVSISVIACIAGIFGGLTAYVLSSTRFDLAKEILEKQALLEKEVSSDQTNTIVDLREQLAAVQEAAELQLSRLQDEAQSQLAAMQSEAAREISELDTDAQELELEVAKLLEQQAEVEAQVAVFENAVRVVRVPFATNRALAPSPTTQVSFSDFGSDEGQLLFGEAVVTLPDTAHTSRLAGELSSRHWLVGLVLQDTPTTNVMAERLTLLQRDVFTHVLRNSIDPEANTALVFVHGFRTSFEEAVQRTGQLVHDLQFPGPAIAFSWPSHGSLTAYRRDQTRAERSVTDLVEVLTLVAEETGADKVIVIAHSMGAYDPTPLNAATLDERMACSKEKSDGREALQTRGDYLEAA